MKPAPLLLSILLRCVGFKAITLPPFGIYVIQRYVDNTRLAKHEAKHWEQYERMGVLKFYAVYLWYSLKYGYRNNPMEIEARKAERLS
jgi:hypothetical protein